MMQYGIFSIGRVTASVAAETLVLIFRACICIFLIFMFLHAAFVLNRSVIMMIII